MRALQVLCETLGHPFRNLDLLARALVHASTGNEGKKSYERLEFLGDSILGFIVADTLYRSFPNASEGELTDWRSRIVSREPLSAVCDALGLIGFVEHGRGLRSSELESDRIKADLVEAVLGAIYLDSGVRAARRFVRAHVLGTVGLPEPARPARPRDPKSQLLHFCQAHGLGQPGYELLGATGPDHDRHFSVAVHVADEAVATGGARSKQLAEMAAAEAAIGILRERYGERAAPDLDADDEDDDLDDTTASVE